MSTHIGSVYVEVLPDAEGFVRDFEAKTKAGMMEAGRKSGNDWSRGFIESTKGTSVRVHADTTAARAEIAALKKDANGAEKPVLGLGTAIAALGPAAVPVAAVAVGAFAGLAPIAGTALLAVKGLVTEFKSGQLAGTAFGKDIQFAQGELGKLEQIAAHNVMGGLHQGFQAVKADIPALNKDVGLMSAQLGNIVGHVGPGLVALFTRVSPLFATIGTDLEHGAASFQHWAQSSSSVSNFVAYVQRELPTVEQTLTNLATTAGHVVQAMEPFGSTTLQMIDLLSGAINKIPVGVLQGLAPAITGAFVGNKIGGQIEQAGNKLSDWASKAQDAGGIASEFSGVAGKLGKALGHAGTVGAIAGAALGVASSVMGYLDKGAQEAAARVNDLAAAMQNGTIAAQVWKDAQDLGIASATKLGLTQQQLIQAVTGSDQKFKDAQAALDRYKDVNDQAALAAGRFGASSQDVAARTGQVLNQVEPVKEKLAELRSEYEAARQKVADWAKQQGDAALAAEVSSGAYQKLASQLGTTSDVYISAKLAADKNTQSTKAQTVAFQLENNAASLLNQALQTLGGQNLDVAQAQTSFHQAVNAATQALKQNHNAIKGNTDAALTNQSAIQAVVSSARQAATAIASQSKSGEEASAVYRRMRNTLLDQLAAQGELTPAVRRYVNQLFDVKGISDYLSKHPTKLDVNNGPAIRKLDAVLTKMHQIGHGVNSVINVTTTYKGGGSNTVKAQAAGTLAAYGQTTIPPNTRFTVGERGWEGGVTDALGRVSIFSHEQAKAMGFKAPTGYANGTGVDGFASQLPAVRAALAASPGQPATARPGGTYIVQGFGAAEVAAEIQRREEQQARLAGVG